MDDAIPDRPRKGRGAVSNRTSRFEPQARVATFDGWEDVLGAADEDPDAASARRRTQVLVDSSRTAITRNRSPDVPFDISVNPYKGCEHGCIYCFARPTHAYLDLSAGLDFETRIFAKPEAAALLEAELRAPGYRPRMLALGANTDP